MSQIVAIELEIPDDLARFRLPPGVQARLQAVLDPSGSGCHAHNDGTRGGRGLVDLAELLSLIRLRAERAHTSTAGHA